ncbi:MAG: hypothetical protein A2Y65_02320 [Deltaproteobacteria bacterium RBG_13_52_11]|nr:MAG: hypothetical protein A2Y65_02320 [Deltaproteobacteria bacterium RBG_13_52_11]
MKGIKSVVTTLIGLTLLFLIEIGFAQPVKYEPVLNDTTKLVKVIKDCYVPYIDTKKLYAVVETSPASSPAETDRTGKTQSIIKGKPGSVNDQTQTIQQTHQYPLSPEVEVRENGKKGLRLDIKTIAGVGFITKADIYIVNNEVVKIIIVDMQQ